MAWHLSGRSHAVCRVPQVPSVELVAQNLPAVVIASFALLLIGFSQTAGDAQAFATKHRYRIDLNQESVAQGMANIGAGLFRGMPVSTSLSASSLNESAGARTPVASLATGAIVIATLILFAPVFSELPKAVLAAVIIDAVVFGMIDLAEFRRLRRVKRFDFWIAVAAVLGVLSVGVLLGVVVGIVLSLLWLINVATRPTMPILGREAGTQVYRDLAEHPEDETDPGVAVIRIDGGLFFATAAALDERVRAILANQPGLHSVVLDLEGVNFVDFAGCGEAQRAGRADRREWRRAATGPPEAQRVDRAGGGRAHRPDRAWQDPRQRAPGGRRRAGGARREAAGRPPPTGDLLTGRSSSRRGHESARADSDSLATVAYAHRAVRAAGVIGRRVGTVTYRLASDLLAPRQGAAHDDCIGSTDVV